MNPNWHSVSIKEAVKLLGGNVKKGLTEKQAKKQLQESGPNKLPKEKPLSRIIIFLRQFQSPLVYILVIAGFISIILKEQADAIVIFCAVFLNTIVGFFQENKASQTLESLKKIVKYPAAVLRQGNLKIINSEELVTGDIVFLNSGDKVPADARIITANNLKINQMSLTGEWLPAEKNPKILTKETPLADRANMVYMGTIVETGKGKIIITETGEKTEIGQIAKMVKKTPEAKTPYQKKSAHLAKIIGIIIAIISLGIFTEGIVRGKEFLEMFTIAIAVAVAAIPEGLPIAMTVILALGMQKILKKQGLVRKLVSAETLGSTSVICSDKTGTLTQGKMEVGKIIGNKPLALKIAALTSESFIENSDQPKKQWIFRGKPTDNALLQAGVKALGPGKTGARLLKKLKKQKIAELPFNSINKWAAGLYQENEKQVLYITGAPERILQVCDLSKNKKQGLEKQLEELTRKGLRVVACAYKKFKQANAGIPNINGLCKNLIFAGFITLKDPLRKDAKKAIQLCKQAGMKPIIITGDHKLTTKAIAKELGFKIKQDNILQGKDLDKLSDKDFDKILDKIQIYARVEPKHKMRIISAWQSRGEVVAMTGDGVNDAPALKKADIGLALGSGTAVAKQTSDLILLNNSFSTIVAAVEQGRAIIDNIRKVITYLLSDAFAEVILIGVSILAGAPLPVTAAQILWVNLVEDGLPDIALAFEPKEKDLMQRKPESAKTPLLTKEMKVLIFIIGLIDDFLLLGLFFWLLNQNYAINYIRTMVFAALAIDTIFASFSCKSLRKNLWQINLLSNKFLIFAGIFGIILLIASIYVPILQTLLKTVPLGFNDWLIIFAIGITEMIFIEITKHYFIVRKQA